MNRTRRGGRVALGVALCVAALVPTGALAQSAIAQSAVAQSAVAGAASGPRDAAHPNIVVIETDDMRTDELQYMPQTISLLQNTGTTFSNSTVSTSLCCPSRAAFLSGQYAQNNKVTDNNEAQRFDKTQTVGTWLTNAGYFTSIIGKYLNGYTCGVKEPPGWSHWQALCKNIYSMYGYTVNDNGVNVKYPKSATTYQTDVLGNRALSTIDEGTASGKPFFIWLTPTAPHSGPGQRPAPQYLTAMKKTYKLPQGLAFNEADVSDKPAWLQAFPPLLKKNINAIQSNELTRIRMLLSVDDMVARIVNELKAQGVYGNTDIIFTSDNGFMRGEHRVPSGKELNYLPSLMVPLIMSGPGIPVGTDNAPAQNTDLAPTILDLAGVASSRPFDGLDLVPSFTDSSSYLHRAILHRQVGVVTQPAHPTGFGVSADQFFYQELTTGESELYDHRADPGELNNVVNDPRYAAVVAQLAPMLHLLEKCAGASCHLTRPDLPPAASFTSNCILHITTCGFSATASDIDGSVASYSWDFGDGSSATGPTVSHTYATEGPYTVTLTVTDDVGVSTFVTNGIVTGHPNRPPTASFATSISDTRVGFDASGSSDSDGSIVSYSWKFGDGSTATGMTPTHDFGVTGDFLVTLTVTDDLGAETSTSQLVSVALPNQPPVARFTVTQTGSSVSLDATASYDPDGSVVQYSWDFGDGTPPDTGDGSSGSGSVTTHTYGPRGQYTITLTVTDDRGSSSTASQVVTT